MNTTTGNTTTAVRRVERVRHEIHVREVTVKDVRRVGENFASITFQGEQLRQFTSSSFDDHVKFIITTPAGEVVKRDYTPLASDTTAGELTVEFYLHEAGPASDWARAAKPGTPATIAGPRGSMVIPTDYPWHLLVGDASALPAIDRRLRELPAGVQAIVIAIADAGDQRSFTSQAHTHVQWVTGADALLAAVRALQLPEGEGFAWCAGEAATMKTVRQVLMEEKGVPKETLKAAAYWKHGAADFHERLDD